MDWQEERFKKWNGWLDIIYSDMTNLLTDKEMFGEVQEIVKNNQSIQRSSLFHSFLRSAYVALALNGLRRQIKTQRDSISLMKLLEEVCCTPEILSKNRFIALYDDQDLGESDFKQFAGTVGSYVDPALVKADLEELKQKVQKCEEYVDRRIAHFDKRKVNDIPTFADLDSSIDSLWSILSKYYLLFRATALLRPVCPYGWQEIFREAWLPPL